MCRKCTEGHVVLGGVECCRSSGLNTLEHPVMMRESYYKAEVDVLSWTGK